VSSSDAVTPAVIVISPIPSTATTAGVIKRRKEDAKGEVEDMLEVQGYKITSLLQPTIEPGHIIKLKSEGIDNWFKVEKVEHQGDTHGTDWKTICSVRFI